MRAVVLAFPLLFGIGLGKKILELPETFANQGEQIPSSSEALQELLLAINPAPVRETLHPRRFERSFGIVSRARPVVANEDDDAGAALAREFEARIQKEGGRTAFEVKYAASEAKKGVEEAANKAKVGVEDAASPITSWFYRLPDNQRTLLLIVLGLIVFNLVISGLAPRPTMSSMGSYSV
mmetsp:Transcript_66957/g.105960  ORF Transcript_66957/g.105960 Transcript_66957/m.105960 type:complete len:181 (-) Transcript_66957:266-808(-)